tara:strand:+ start:26 stop:1663 length:1638 start_codon:yes stop_codon:yes gene_type:complete
MDEEQGLGSPIAGGIRGINRSVSSSVFTGRSVLPQVSQPAPLIQAPPPPPQPDPQTTALLNQNSLSLSNVSSQLTTISDQIINLNNSLVNIKSNLDVNDSLDRQREAARQKREAILAEQGLREGKESELERKIQTALLAPVRRVAGFARGILSRLAEFLFILAGGWLTDKTLSFLRLSSEGNVDKLNEFKRKFLTDLLILGGIGTVLTLGVGKIAATIGSLAGIALKIAFGGLLVRPFKSILNFILRNVNDFRKFALKKAGEIITKGPGSILKIFKPKNLLLGGGIVGTGIGLRKQIGNFFKSITGRKIANEALEQTTKTTAKTGTRGFLRRLPIVGSLLDVGFGVMDYKDRREKGETKKEAGFGATGNTLGGIIGFLTAATLIPEPISSAIGGFGLAIIGILTSMGFAAAGGKIGDELSGLNEKRRNDPNYATGNEQNKEGEVSYEAVNFESVDKVTPNTANDKNITPINMKKELNVSEVISQMDESAQVTILGSDGSPKKGMPASATMATSSSIPSDSLPSIPSSDFANNFIALSESLYNVSV